MVTRRSALSLFGTAPLVLAAKAKNDGRLKRSFRKPEKNGWIPLHLEGEPNEIGFQHGYWLAREIATAHRTIAFELQHDSNKDWRFFRGAAKEYYWPHVEAEYREE